MTQSASQWQPSKHESLTQCRVNVKPTLGQRLVRPYNTHADDKIFTNAPYFIKGKQVA